MFFSLPTPSLEISRKSKLLQQSDQSVLRFPLASYRALSALVDTG